MIKTTTHRLFLLLWLILAGGSILSYGQGNTNAAAAATVMSTAASSSRAQLSFGLDRIPELRMEILQIPLWQYLATLIYIVIAVVAARLIDYLVTVWLTRLAARTKTRLDDLLIELLHGPAKILAFIILLWLGMEFFRWPIWFEHWLKNGFKLVLASSLTYLALKLVDLVASYWRTRPALRVDKSFNDLLLPLLSKSVKGFILIMAVLVTLDNLNFNIRTLLAGVSISGLALGLAAQDTVGNLFGAAAVFIDKPFKIGDRIQLNGIDGTVEEMGLRSTRVRNPEGHLITVPNKTMGNATITNVTRRPNIKTVINIGLTYDTPPAKVAEATTILKEVYERHPMTSEVTVGFNQFGDSALNINVVHFWKELENKEYIAGMQALNLEIMSQFSKAGIDFAFPSRTVYLRQDGECRLQTSERDKG
ncbi:MAG TPA: mechanosensitive ion channel domain-containing protein [Verrucomicrobiae bacterium]|nr:mechanosensitive ion channel domain-containing protein [Verrucomicrobiae bacterium]